MNLSDLIILAGSVWAIVLVAVGGFSVTYIALEWLIRRVRRRPTCTRVGGPHPDCSRVPEPSSWNPRQSDVLFKKPQ